MASIECSSPSLLTSENTYVKIEDAYLPDSDRTGAIALPELGINGKHWFNPSVISAYKRHFKGKELSYYYDYID